MISEKFSLLASFEILLLEDLDFGQKSPTKILIKFKLLIKIILSLN